MEEVLARIRRRLEPLGIKVELLAKPVRNKYGGGFDEEHWFVYTLERKGQPPVRIESRCYSETAMLVRRDAAYAYHTALCACDDVLRKLMDFLDPPEIDWWKGPLEGCEPAVPRSSP